MQATEKMTPFKRCGWSVCLIENKIVKTFKLGKIPFTTLNI